MLGSVLLARKSGFAWSTAAIVSLALSACGSSPPRDQNYGSDLGADFHPPVVDAASDAAQTGAAGAGGSASTGAGGAAGDTGGAAGDTGGTAGDTGGAGAAAGSSGGGT